MAQADGLLPWLQPWAEYLLAWAGRYDPALAVTSVRRSSSEQARLYRRYLAGQSLYPAAPPGQSLHEQGRAFDVVARPEVLEAMGKVWESWGGTWGGRYGAADPIHFQA